MHRRHKKLLGSVIFIIISIAILVAQPQEPTNAKIPGSQLGYYKVTDYYDGDTIAVDMQGTTEKVRLIGVDTPETHDPRKNVQCFGQAASQFTKNLINNQLVRLEADPTNSNRDRYQRLLRYVFLPDGQLVNAEIIKQGYGFAYTAFPFIRLDEFRAYEKLAREQNRGLWTTCTIKIEDNGSLHTNDAV